MEPSSSRKRESSLSLSSNDSQERRTKPRVPRPPSSASDAPSTNSASSRKSIPSTGMPKSARRPKRKAPQESASSSGLVDTGSSKRKCRRTTPESAVSISTVSTRSTSSPDADLSQCIQRLRRESSTCLSVGLDPIRHSNLICEQCRDYLSVSCRGNLKKAMDLSVQRPGKYICKRPWDGMYKDHYDTGKEKRRVDILSVFGVLHLWDKKAAEQEGNNNNTNVRTKERSTNKNNSQSDNEKSPLPPIILENKFEAVKATEPSKKKRLPRYVVEKDNTITVEAVEKIMMALNNREKQSLTEVEITLLQKLKAFAGDTLIEKDSTLNEKAAGKFMEALEKRKHNTERAILTVHEARLLSELKSLAGETGAIVDGKNIIMPHVATTIGKALEGRKDGAKGLRDHENRLLGQLYTVGSKSSSDDGKITVLPNVKSFKHYRKFSLVRVPTQYNVSSDTSRYTKNAADVAMEWMALLSSGNNNFLERLVVSIMSDNPDIASECVTAYQTKYKRMSPEATAATQGIANLNDSQMEKLAQAIYFYTGIRIFAPKGKMATLKQEYIEQEYKSIKYTPVKLQRKVTKGNETMYRDEWTLVVTVRPVELLLSALQKILPDKYVVSTERFTAPFLVDGTFKDVILIKISMDSGGGSSKGCCNVVNVENPQGLEHTFPFLEFTGKDTHENLRRAAWKPDSKVRRDVERMTHRKCVAVDFTTMHDHQIIVAINSDPKHDRFAPDPLPPFSGYTEIQSTLKITESGIVELDFTIVNTIKVLYNAAGKSFQGLSFFSLSYECIATAKFRRPIIIEQSPSIVSMNIDQYIVASVFSADLLLLSTFFGHQGSGAKNPCIFCLALLDSMKHIFDEDESHAGFRTLEGIEKAYQVYESMYLKEKEIDQTKTLRKETTQVFSQSINLPALGDIPLDCVARAMMHVLLGFTRALIEMKFQFMKKVETLALGAGGAARATVEKQLEQVKAYEKWLEAQIEGVKIAIAAQEEQTNLFMSRLARIGEVLSMESLPPAERATWETKLQKLEQEYEQWRESLGATDQEEEDHKFQVLEQLGVVKQTKDELATIVKTNEGFSRRVVVAVLKKHGVDMKLYHDGMIIGNHCFEYAKNGKIITHDIVEMMKEQKEVKDNDELKSFLDKFEDKMTAIVEKWYDVIRVIKRVRKLTDWEIRQYEIDLEKLRQAIVILIRTDPPMPGDNNPLTFPTTRKTHILFGKDSKRFLNDWHTFGGVNEENMESLHAVFNQLKRRYCGVRGKRQKKLIYNATLYGGANFIRTGIDEVKNGTRAKNPAKKLAKKKSSESTTNVQQDVSVNSEALDHSDASTDVLDWDALIDAVQTDTILTDKLSEDEVEVNRNPALHMFEFEGQKLNTKISICPECKRRYLGLAFETHRHEIHSATIVEEADGGDVKMAAI